VKSIGLLFIAMVIAALLLSGPACMAAGPAQVVTGSQKKINLEVGKSAIVRASRPVVRVSLAAPEIADYLLLSPTQVYLTGKQSGVTNLTLWQDQEKILAVYDIEVAPDLSRLKSKLQQLLPEEKDLRVRASHDALTLSGTVTNTASLAQAVALAEAYNTKDRPLINLVQVAGTHQVMLEVRVAEMSRALTRRLSINFVVRSGGSIGTSLLGGLGTINQFTGGRSGSLLLDFTQNINALFHIAGGSLSWTTFLDALKDEGLIKILAEPTLITLSGQTASFLAGGEFPVPVPQERDTVTIEWKKYGVELTFTPTVLSDKKINMKVHPKVSELDFSTAVNLFAYSVPGLTTREVSTVIELADGQSFAIAGLLQDSIRENVRKFPFLGDLPVLGPLFRSSEFLRKESELIVIVTAHLVKPLDVARQKLPTDGYVAPNDTEFYLMGLTRGRGGSGASSLFSGSGKRGLEGEFGHALPQ
jgi:pilus assembly protein CpaC